MARLIESAALEWNKISQGMQQVYQQTDYKLRQM